MAGLTLTERLVGVAAATAPPREAAARSLLDALACIGAGGEPAWPDTFAGRLAAAAHALDRDDLHLGSLTHPGGVVWPAVAETALERGATLGDAVAAAALGYELVVRIAEALGPEHRRSWHTTATAGTVGAAGAAAHVLGADPAVAVGHALSVAGGAIQALPERSGTRLVHRVHAVATGVGCARAARAGIDATRHGLESGTGAFQTVDADALLAPRSLTALEETGFRLHGATGFAHAAIDAAALLAPLHPAAVAAVEVRLGPPAALALASDSAPGGDEQAWWSVEHAVAARLASDEAGPLAAGLSSSADVLALCRRVSLEAADGWGATVVVAFADGTADRGEVDEPWGHGLHPATDRDLLAKWRALTGHEGDALLDLLLTADAETPFRSALEAARVVSTG